MNDVVKAKPKPHDYVIVYMGKPRSHFKGWTSRIQIPMFGAKLSETPRFETEELAKAELRKMPAQAALMCDVRPVPRLKVRKN